MATRYGVQFETLMAEVCRDFGAKLVKSWDQSAPKDEIREFVEEAVMNFFKVAVAVAVAVDGEPEPEPEPEPVKKNKRASKAKKAKSPEPEAEPEPESPSGMTDPEPEPEPVKKKRGGKVAAKADVKGKAKVTEPKKDMPKGKPKCQAVTAKGTPCSKCAVESGPFCSVHLKKAVVAPKGKGGKGLTKGTKVATPVKEVEVCDKAGDELEKPVPTSPELDMEEYMSESEQDDMGDENYRLEEEDFDEID